MLLNLIGIEFKIIFTIEISLVAGMVICLKQGADLHMSQLRPLVITIYCFSKIQIDFTFLVLAYTGSPRQSAVKQVCVSIKLITFFCTVTHSVAY